LARGGGYWTLGLALLMLVAVTESLTSAAWSEGLAVVRYAVFGGALLAFALSLTRWDGIFPAVYSLLASFFWITTCFNWVIFQELSPQAGVQELLRRNWDWFAALFTGRASADNLIFVTQLALLGWWIGYLALWSLMRHQRLLHAVLPAGVAVIVNAYFASQNMTGFVILYLAAVLLLAIRIELARNETRWQLTRIRYAPDIALDFLRAGVIFAALVILLAWAVPDVANQFTMERLLRPLEGPWQTVEDNWQRMYKSLNPGRQVAVTSTFGKTALLGGPVSLTDRPIFEAETPERTYWRGATYDTYTGQGWLNTDPEVVVLDRNQPLDEPAYEAMRAITATVSPLEAGQEVIFSPPAPVRVSVPTNADATLLPGEQGERSISQLRTRVNLNREGGYWVAAHVSDAAPERLRADRPTYPQWVAERYLQLPDTVPSRVTNLAAKITAAYDNPYDKAEAIEAVLRTYDYNQGIAAPPPGADAVDYFLNDVKQGYCDYYASAMVVMLRSVGIPARFAVGYTPGKVVPQQALDESGLTQYRVLENNAHAWPEVFFPSYGWVQFEPTASEPLLVRPVEQPAAPLDAGLQPQNMPNMGQPGILPDSDLPSDLTPIAPSDALASWLGHNWGWLAALAGLIALVAAGAALLRRRQRAFFRSSEALFRLFDLLGTWAGRLHIPWPASHTPLEHAAAFNSAVPEAGPTVDHLATLFVAQQYGRQEPSAQMLVDVADNWQTLRPKLWRRWLGGQRFGRGSDAPAAEAPPAPQ
jgi:transglutaminase-like putative cysteine protease